MSSEPVSQETCMSMETESERRANVEETRSSLQYAKAQEDIKSRPEDIGGITIVQVRKKCASLKWTNWYSEIYLPVRQLLSRVIIEGFRFSF